MSKNLISALIVVLTMTLVVPATFFIAPQKASASAAGCIGSIIGLGSGAGASLGADIVSVPVSDAVNTSVNGGTLGNTGSNCINDLILVPLARAAIRALLQKITQSTINWINGSNGTGQSSYVPNLGTHLQGVGDSAVLSFIAQTATGFNSPFGPSISSALSQQYAQQTSLAGFYSANQCTLSKSSPNINAFLAGNWSQGGNATWLTLTTQPQNNPYTLYQITTAQAGSNNNQAVTNRRQDLLQSNGLLSFCAGDTTTNYSIANRPGGISPQVSCTGQNGKPAQVSTPGSVISSYLQTNVNSGIGQLVSAQDLDQALGQIVSALVNQVIGPKGLFGSSQPSSSTNTTVTATAATPSSAATSAASLAQSMLTQLTTYTNAWNTIAAAANAAQASVTAFQNACAADTSTTQGMTNQSAAQAALSTEITPVLTQVQTASSTAATAQALALKVQAEAVTIPIADPNQFSTDVSTLASLPPVANDVISVQLNANVTNQATSSPAGSLTVSGGTLVDKMNLISKNAAALTASGCASTVATTTTATSTKTTP
jgi:hypothetical protein